MWKISELIKTSAKIIIIFISIDPTVFTLIDKIELEIKNTEKQICPGFLREDM